MSLASPCGAEVAHSLGKTVVMGSSPITGSRGFLNDVWLDALYAPLHLHEIPRRRIELVAPSSELIVTPLPDILASGSYFLCV